MPEWDIHSGFETGPLDPHFPPGSLQITWFLACLQMNSHIASSVAQVPQQVHLGSLRVRVVLGLLLLGLYLLLFIRVLAL